MPTSAWPKMNSKRLPWVDRLRLALLVTLAAVSIACPSGKRGAQSTLSSAHSVTLTWQPSPGASYYTIYRSAVSKSGYQKIGTSRTPIYKDAPVPSGATFYYVVTGVGDKGESHYSGEIKAVVP